MFRQIPPLGCKALTMMLTALAVLAGAIPAQAAAPLRIVATPTVAEAPVTLTLSAHSTSTEPIVDYRWGGLDVFPRCHASDCELPLPIALCSRVEVEATTDLGKTTTATAAACANGGPGTGRPPRARLEFAEDATTVRIATFWEEGSDAIIVKRLWIDDGLPIDVPAGASFMKDGGCHAVDLLVGDRAGRIGIDRRTYCTDPDAPVVSLVAKGGPFPELGVAYELCAEADHPLGLELELLAGEVPLNRCLERPGPAELTRHLLRARDTRGIITTASLLSIGAPVIGESVLVFAQVGGGTGREGKRFSATMEIFGGEGPFEIDATLVDATGATTRELEVDSSANARRPELTLASSPREGTWRIDVQVKDSRGMITRASGIATISPPEMMMMQEPPDPQATRAGCSDTQAGGSPAALTAILATLALALCWRRR